MLSRNALFLATVLVIVPGLVCGQATKTQTDSHAPLVTLADPFWKPNITRDPQAAELIQQALTALGGEQLWGQVKSLQIEGHLTNDATQHFLWQMSGADFRMLTENTAGHVEMNSGSGAPFRDNNGTSTPIAHRFAVSMFVPGAIGALLYRISNNPQYSLTYTGLSTIGGDEVKSVRVILQSTRLSSTTTVQTWHFSASSGLPIRIEFRLFDEHQWLAFTDSYYDLSDYSTFQGLTFPQVITTTVNQKQRASTTITSVTINPTLAETLFSSREGGAQ